MPQIPTYTAQGKAIEQDYPRDVPTQDYAGLAKSGQALEQIGRETGQIAGNLDYLNKVAKLEADKNTFKINKGTYDAAVRNAKLEIEKDPLIVDADRAEKAFIFREKKIREDVFKASNQNVQGMLSTHVQENYLGNVVDAKTIGVKKAGDYAVGQLDKLKNVTIDNASRSVSLGDFEKELNNYENSLTSARDKGLITAKDYEDRKIAITNKAFDARADVLINQDPELFRATVQRGDFNNMQREALAGKMEKAEAESHQRQVRIDQATTKQRHDTEEYWGKLAMMQKLPPEMINNARAGRDPFMTDPDKITKYEKLNANPPTVELDNSVRLMKENYRAEFVLNPSESIIDKYAQRAVKMMTDHPNNELSILLNELASDKGQLRGIQAAGFARVTRTLSGEETSLKTPKVGMPRYDSFMEKLDQNDARELKSSAYDIWRSGGTPEDMEKGILNKAEEIRKRKDTQGKGKTKQQESDEAIYGRRD